MDGIVFIRCGSHRAMERVRRSLGRPLDWYATIQEGGRFTTVTPEEYDAVKGIPCISRPRKQDGYLHCWGGKEEADG